MCWCHEVLQRSVREALESQCFEQRQGFPVLVRIGVVTACARRDRDGVRSFAAYMPKTDFTASCPELLAND